MEVQANQVEGGEVENGHQVGERLTFGWRGRGGGEDRLCELKVLSASRSRFPRNPQPRDGSRALDRRAAGLTADYLSKARQVDQQLCGTPAPPPPQPGVQ